MGTFTSVAGVDGRAIEWLPLGGPTDLPCFVKHFGTTIYKVAPGDPNVLLDYESAKATLWGKVRMETPVLYFYAGKPASLDVRVQFPRGIVTEFYPAPTGFQPTITPTTLRQASYQGYVEWRGVQVSPTVAPTFAHSGGSSRYYAARATDATPLRVGRESEKFLFYRGVGGFDVPIEAIAGDDGSVRTRNLGAWGALPNVVLFENRGGRIGYRINGELTGQATISAPVLSGSLTVLRTELASLLVHAGLTQKEAAAMVETWRDSWFEEGTRVFYILPSRAVDAILPLTITPEPDSVARVFVGRMDVITRTTLNTVERAIATDDTQTLLRYARFLNPITDRLLAYGVNATTASRIRGVTTKAFAKYVSEVRECH